MSVSEIKDAEYFSELSGLSARVLEKLQMLLRHRIEVQQDIKDDVVLRWQQGRCQELAELVNDIEAAHHKYIHKRFGGRVPGMEHQRF